MTQRDLVREDVSNKFLQRKFNPDEPLPTREGIAKLFDIQHEDETDGEVTELSNMSSASVAFSIWQSLERF